MPDNSMVGIEQGRAKKAYEYVKEAVSETYKGNYKSYVKKIPSLIKINGLGNTFAFVKSKGGPAYTKIYDQAYRWLMEDDPKKLINISNMEDANDLVKILIELDSPTYRAVTLEVLALFNWMKRFVDSMIPDDKNSNQQNQDDEEANE